MSRPSRRSTSPSPAAAGSRDAPAPDVTALVDALRRGPAAGVHRRRGARRRPGRAARWPLLADRCGALLAVSAAAKGLFAGDPWYLDVSGGFATPLAAELIGAGRPRRRLGQHAEHVDHPARPPDRRTAVVAQVDLEAERSASTDRSTSAWSATWPPSRRRARLRWRPNGVAVNRVCARRSSRARIAAEGRWRLVPYVDEGADGLIDPRTLTIALDDLLPAERTVVIDSGNFMGYPSMFLSVPDAAGFCFTQAFQSIGLGLASALGAAVARPDRLTVAALGDGGFLMSAAELATAATLGLPLLIVVYNDAAYGAEVHHFGPDGYALDTVRFPDTDLAAIGRGFGLDGVTVRSSADLEAVCEWLDGPRERPLVVDAKVVSEHGSWWLEEAFRGH